MPTVYLRKDLHEAIVLKHEDVNNFVNRAVEKALNQSASEPFMTSNPRPASEPLSWRNPKGGSAGTGQPADKPSQGQPGRGK